MFTRPGTHWRWFPSSIPLESVWISWDIWLPIDLSWPSDEAGRLVCPRWCPQLERAEKIPWTIDFSPGKHRFSNHSSWTIYIDLAWHQLIAPFFGWNSPWTQKSFVSPKRSIGPGLPSNPSLAGSCTKPDVSGETKVVTHVVTVGDMTGMFFLWLC